MDQSPETSIFVVPRSSTTWRGNEAGWITASGWASAGKALWGDALVATTDGVFPPEESRTFPRNNNPPSVSRQGIVRRLVPEVLVTAYKDYALWKSKPSVWPIEDDQWTGGKKVRFVWERHDLFGGPGRRLADRHGVPLVTSAEAVVVWEARKWGVERPGWGAWLERHGEGAHLKKSDLVICVTEDVRRKVVSLGVADERTMVTPNRVDSSLFHPKVSGEQIRQKYNLAGRRVIGWTGSFRRFHGLSDVIRAFDKVHRTHKDTVLMLVGDGQERERMQQLALELNLKDTIVFPGRIPFTEVPSFVAAFDVALVTAASALDFHYSPLKLREYLALGRPVIAARAGDLPKLFSEDRDLLFYQAGDVHDLSSVLLRLLDDGALQQRLQQQAIRMFEADGTWRHELVKVCTRLGISYSPR